MARTLTNEIIDAAIEGFEAQKRRIDDQISELRSMRDGHNSPAVSGATVAPRKRKFSPDALRRMREAQQRRWATVRGDAEPSAPAASESPKKKRHLSAAGRKAIQEALRRRWAQKRAAAERTKPATKKATQKKAAKAKPTAAKRAPRKKLASKPAQAVTAPASE